MQELQISSNTVSTGYDQSQPGTNPESHPDSSSERPRKLAWISARLTANCIEKLGKSIYPIEFITKTDAAIKETSDYSFAAKTNLSTELYIASYCNYCS